MIIAFFLSMPNRGSWNGNWSGDGKQYVVTRKYYKTRPEHAKKIKNILDGKETNSHFYSWKDGWSANVRCTIVDAKEAQQLRKQSAGFCGYNWMIDTIEQHGKIVNSNDNKED